MKYHTLFFLKIREDDRNLLSAAVMIGALKVNNFFAWFEWFACRTHSGFVPV